MREIKFRAVALESYGDYEDDFYIKKGEIVDWETIQGDRNYWLDNENFGVKFNLMQYTGLLDKNGNEIYEGDIIKITLADRYINREVKFTNGSFKFGKERIWLDLEEEFKEIIGNIYENQELLTK